MTPLSTMQQTVPFASLLSRCLNLDPAELTSSSEALEQTPEPLLDRLVRSRILDRIAARALWLVAQGQLDTRDLKQLLPTRRPRARRPLAGHPPAVVAVPKPGTQLGKYVLTSLCGTGGGGAVYRAFHPHLGIPVAVKWAARGEPALRLQHEAAVLARIQHRNVVRLWDADHADAGSYLVLEFVGRNLREVLARRGRFEPTAAFRVARHMVAALRATFRSGFLHGDVKPANILVSRERIYKLSDFGLARRHTQVDEHADRLSGSWAYLAPEAFDGTRDHRSDIYSLGLTLHHLLAGQPAIGSANYDDCLRAHRTLSLEPLHWTVPGVSRAMSTLILRMTARHPDDRPADYEELLAELRRAATA